MVAVINLYANTIKYMFASGHDVAANPHAIGARLFSTVNPDMSGNQIIFSGQAVQHYRLRHVQAEDHSPSRDAWPELWCRASWLRTIS